MICYLAYAGTAFSEAALKGKKKDPLSTLDSGHHATFIYAVQN
jgi:hypothetical protein